ncbi:MAG: NUDIX hydrolase [Bacteroidales bacterium]|nr:NUDIX hydrolase [Bacteroidales bacterium]
MAQGYTYKYPHPAVTADCVIFGFDGKDLKILLIERANEPYKGCWAFPGGFMNIDETAEQCAKRELNEETGLEIENIEQFHTFSDVNRDPRERIVTVAFFGLVKLSEVVGGDDAARAQWFSIKDIPRLAFDHDYMLRIAQRTLKERIHFEPIGFELLGDEFSMPDLQRLYEAILEIKFDRRNFEKKMLQLGILDQIGKEEDECEKRRTGISDYDYHYRDLGRNANLMRTYTRTSAPKTNLVIHDVQDVPKSRGKNRKFRFNRKKYDEMKEKGIFKIEF